MLSVIFENEEVLVVNKPAGLIVNNSNTSGENTLQDLVAHYLKLKEGNLGIGSRAGIVHRLDRETSGLLIVAKTDEAFLDLQDQFKKRQVQKKYVALVHGVATVERLNITTKIGRIGTFGKFGIVEAGKESETEIVKTADLKFKISDFQSIIENENFNKVRVKYLNHQAINYSLFSVYPKTGRTHQIRVHLKSIGHPIVSDLIYEPAKLLKFDLLWCPRLFLHAEEIEFYDKKHKKRLNFSASLPSELKVALLHLTSED